jgi:hypothetical protein
VLSELDVGASDETRLDRHVALVRRLVDERARPPGEGERTGAVIVVEPALRDRTRHLHRVRDALAASGVGVFAPCLHQAPCPALVRQADWCHEDLPVDLPGWLVPVARAAGLRYEGLTFSYLVLQRSGGSLAEAAHAATVAPQGAAHLRVVSDVIRTKGKREAYCCGQFAGAGGLVAARERVTRLDRTSTGRADPFANLVRGDVLVVDPPLELARPRLGADSAMRVLGVGAARIGEDETR